MNKSVKERWIKALESGEYNYGRDYLYNYEIDCHCAVGVLIELALEDGVNIGDIEKTDYGVANFNGNARMINSINLNHWAGVDRADLNLVAKRSDSGESINDDNKYRRAIDCIKEIL